MKPITSDQFLKLVFGLNFNIVKRDYLGKEIVSILSGVEAHYSRFNKDVIDIRNDYEAYYAIDLEETEFYIDGYNVVLVKNEDFHFQMEFYRRVIKEEDIEGFLRENP